MLLGVVGVRSRKTRDLRSVHQGDSVDSLRAGAWELGPVPRPKMPSCEYENYSGTCRSFGTT
jgi:hypothetical protein